ncbi:MAG TPA: hypothetical protein VNO30_09895 [Kofleriaceae bacterium]|nr:hypothetical protein [Kofleriaceae bacterium]
MLSALIVGALTAWYLGLRAGAIAAAVTLAALLVAGFVPGLSLAVYTLVLAWSAALYFLGPKIAAASSKRGNGGGGGGWLDGLTGQAKAWARKMMIKR